MLLFLKVFFTEFIAEMGDKTQLMLIALTSKYKLRDIILGTGAAILLLNGLAVLAGGFVSAFIPEWLIKTIAALAFVIFAIFGVYTFYQGLNLISASVCPLPVWPVLIAATAVFVVLCVCLFIKREKKTK